MPESTRNAYGGRVGEGTDAIYAQIDSLEQRVGVSSFAPLDNEQHETRKKRCLFYPLRSRLDECERVCERSVGYTGRISATQHSTKYGGRTNRRPPNLQHPSRLFDPTLLAH